MSYNNLPYRNLQLYFLTFELHVISLLLLPLLCLLRLKMSKFSKQPVTSEHALQSPLFSQAIVSGGTVYVSGNIGIIPSTLQVVEGSVADRTV